MHLNTTKHARNVSQKNFRPQKDEILIGLILGSGPAIAKPSKVPSNLRRFSLAPEEDQDGKGDQRTKAHAGK